jgi:hypothetical protein
MKTKKMILTEKLKTRIVDLAKGGRWFDFLLDTDSELSLVIKDWIERGMQEETGIYHEYVKEIMPFWIEAEYRQVERLTAQIVEMLKTMPKKEGDIFLASILSPVLNPRYPMRMRDMRRSVESQLAQMVEVESGNALLIQCQQQRDELAALERAEKDARLMMASQIANAIGPIDKRRFKFLEKKLGRILEREQRSLQLSAIFEAATALQREKGRDFGPPDSYKDMRRRVNEMLSEDLLPGWRRKDKESDSTWMARTQQRHADPRSAKPIRMPVMPKLPVPSERGSPSPFQQLLENEEAKRREEQRRFLIQQAVKVSKKTPKQVADIMHRSKDISELAKKLGITRLNLYRKVIDPIRKR